MRHRYLTFGLLLLVTSLVAHGQSLPRTIEEARALEQADALPPSLLYTRSYDLSGSNPGHLLAQEAFSGYEVKGLGRAVRIAYHSADAEDKGVITTAMVLIPRGAPPAGGWPIIAFGHGTSGVARPCAPSLMKDAFYGDEGLSDMLKAGFAVIATDYHGLGSEGEHAYIDKPAQARDIVYAVPAARAAVPELGSRWVADGHSQGGLAAWGVAEFEAVHEDANYLGAVSVSGASSLDGFFQFLDANPGMNFYLSWAAAGIHTRFPEFSPEDVLTPIMMDKYQAVTREGCWYFGYVNYKNTPKNATLKTGWRGNVWLRRWVEENRLGRVRITKPLLVISGEADVTVSIQEVRETVRQACAAGSTLAFRSYPGLDHDPTMIKSAAVQIAWIRERFADKPFKGTCAAQAAQVRDLSRQ
jgi:alpha-beta hydrolase superfamily lysophospholipase